MKDYYVVHNDVSIMAANIAEANQIIDNLLKNNLQPLSAIEFDGVSEFSYTTKSGDHGTISISHEFYSDEEN